MAFKLQCHLQPPCQKNKLDENIFHAMINCYSFLRLLYIDFLKCSYYINKKFQLHFQVHCTYTVIQSTHV